MTYNKPKQPTAAIALRPVQEITKDNALQAFTNIQQFFPPDKFNTIKPVQQITPANLKGMRPDIKILDLSQHCYEQTGSKALTKAGILQLADAYDVTMEQTFYEFKRGESVTFSFRASMIKDGFTKVGYPGTQTIDLAVEEESIMLKFEEMADKTARSEAAKFQNYREGDIWQQWNGNWNFKGNWKILARKEILQVRKNMVRMCESKAMLAAIRNVLGIKPTYTVEEMSKAFVTFRMVPDYSEMSPEQIIALRTNADNAATLLTGQPLQTPSQAYQGPQNEPENFEAPTAEDLGSYPDEDYMDVEFEEVRSHEAPENTQQVHREANGLDEHPGIQTVQHSDGAGHSRNDSSNSGQPNGQPHAGRVDAKRGETGSGTAGGFQAGTGHAESTSQHAQSVCSAPECGTVLSPGVLKFCRQNGWNPPVCMKHQPKN